MNKPEDFDGVQAYGDYTPLPAGGYYCKVIKVEKTQSSTMKPMLKIYIDIVDGEYKDYYAESYKSDTRDPKKWGCIVYQLIYDNEGKTSRGFKTFITSVEESNNVSMQWGDKFENFLKNKLIGGLFRREEYMKQDGTPAWSTKCFAFRSISSIENGVPIPEDKPLAQTAPGPYSFKAAIPALSDDDLPF